MKKAIFSLCGLLAFSTTFFGQYLSFISGIQSISAESTLPVRTFENGGALSCTVTYNFTAATISEQEVSGEVYQFLHINGFTKMTQVGAPALPAYNEIIAMPKNAVGKIVLIHAEYKEYQGYMIHPALMPANDTEGSPEPEFEKDESIYNSDEFFPKEPVEITEILLCRGVPIAVSQVRPIQFNPVTGTIRVYTQMKFRLEFIGGTKSFSDIGESNSRDFTNKLKRYVVNPESIPDGIQNSESLLGPGANNYIIITHSNYLSAANDLANWKRQLGYTVEVVSQASWTTTQVTTAIHTRYHGWAPHPDYFVIIGDHAGLYAVPGETATSIWSPYPTFKTDNYYSCMDGAGDYVPDMARGRISVSSLSEANTAVQKMIAYEKNPVNDPAFYATALHCAAFQDTDDFNDYADRRFCQTSEEVRDYMLANTTYTVERIYQTDDAANPTNWNNGTYSAGEPIPTALLRSSGFPWKGGWHPGESDIITAINAGRFYVLHRDHGYTGGSGWADPYFTTTSINSITNTTRQPVIFSINCHTGEFQLAECFAEKLIRKNNGGAIGVFAAAHASPSGYNDGFAMGLFDAIWSNPGLTPNFTGSGGSSTPPTPHADIYTLGDVLNHGLIRQVQTWNGYYNYFEHELMHYFGDPAMKIWTANPNTSVITATHSSTINCAGTSFAISGSTPDATATLVVNNELISKTTLDGSGSGSLAYSITGPSPAVMLTISKHNHKPYVSSLTMNGTCSFPPAIETQATLCVGSSTATAYGNITHDFGSSVIESGVVFGTNPNPEINSNGVTKVQTSPTVTSGSYSFSLTGLGSNTTHYLRAYAMNANGTGYGENDVFTTLPGTGILPWTEDWENAGTVTYTADQNSLDGLPEWDYDMVDAGGRLRFEAGSGFYHGGSRAATLDRYPSGAYNTNYLIATVDLSNYSSSTDLELSFYYMHHGADDLPNNRVWIRGSNTGAWVEIYNLYANQGTAGNWNTVSNLDIDAYLAAASPSQTVSSTFQLRFGQCDNWPATSTTASDGYTFDDISITKLSPLANLNVQNVAITNNQSGCFDATNILTVAGSGSTVNIYSGGEANFIAGSKVVFNPGFNAHSGSEVSAFISTGTYCSGLPPMVATTVNDEENSESPDMLINLSPEIKIYPNPTIGHFTIDFMGKETTADILVLNYQGNQIYQTRCDNQIKMDINISHLPCGMYIIVIKSQIQTITKKIIKVK